MSRHGTSEHVNRTSNGYRSFSCYHGNHIPNYPKNKYLEENLRAQCWQGHGDFHGRWLVFATWEEWLLNCICGRNPVYIIIQL